MHVDDELEKAWVDKLKTRAITFGSRQEDAEGSNAGSFNSQQEADSVDC
jgi:hypothetical protein